MPRDVAIDTSVAEAVARVLAAEPDLAAGVREGRPKTWGPLAAKAVVALRELLGRAPTDPERRMVWDALWRALHEGR